MTMLDDNPLAADTVRVSVSLYYREGTSDKVYLASVKEVAAGFIVDFAYGRRGTPLKTGLKTSSPVTLEKATQIYTKLVNEKTGKGYVADPNGAPFRHLDKSSQVSGVNCQLLNPITREEMELLLCDDDWFMQEKFDGDRLMVKKDAVEVAGINRKGLFVSIATEIERDYAQLSDQFIFDGEGVASRQHVFDVLELNGVDLRGLSVEDRLVHLESFFRNKSFGSVLPVYTARTTEEKINLLAQVEWTNGEGVVFKRRDARYVAGRPASLGNQLKFPFYKTATFRVRSVNSQRSVLLELFNDLEWVPAGNVTIPPNYDVPVPGSLVDVRYLYAYRQSGSVAQPVYRGPRIDLEDCAAHVNQLQYKAE